MTKSEIAKKYNVGKWMKGKKHSQETKQRMSIASKGKPKSKEHIQKVKEALTQTGKISYQAIHTWLKTNFEKASRCENPNCKGISKNYNWCLLKEKQHERKRKNYIQLCISCHRLYDGHIPWNKGKKYKIIKGRSKLINK